MSPPAVPTVPEPLPPTAWKFPPSSSADRHGVVGVGADLAPSTLIHAYRHGLFPMPADDDSIGWWSPPRRGVLDFDDLIVSRSLRRSCRRFGVTINTCFAEVITSCAEVERPGGWISPEIIEAYVRLHELGWAHSIETWHDGELVGGLYGVQVAGLFAGESMFRRATDASKVALVALVGALVTVGASLLDVQWQTDHLATLGVHEITRREYLRRVGRAVTSATGSIAELSAQNSQSNTPQYLDRILLKPTGTHVPVPSPATPRSTP